MKYTYTYHLLFVYFGCALSQEQQKVENIQRDDLEIKQSHNNLRGLQLFCDDINRRSICNLADDCFWSDNLDVCLNKIVCTDLDMRRFCNLAEECFWSEILGTCLERIECDNIESKRICNLTDACTWSNLLDRCIINIQCDDIEDKRLCDSTFRCEWVETRFGDGCVPV